MAHLIKHNERISMKAIQDAYEKVSEKYQSEEWKETLLERYSYNQYLEFETERQMELTDEVLSQPFTV